MLIRYDSPALRLAEILYGRLLEMGINPVQRIGLTPTMEQSFFTQSNSRQLVFTVPGEKAFYQGLNGSIFLRAPESMTHLKDVDPKKIGKAAVARKYLRDVLDKREEQGHYGWTLCIHPTAALTRHAKLSSRQYANQIVKACYLNKTSPVSAWETMYQNAASIKKWLNSLKIKHLHITSENIDLEVTPGDRRKWIGISGHNIPSFEIFVSPDWRGSRGTYLADQPSYRNGNYVEGVRLEFKKGSVVRSQAKQGEKFLKQQLSMDRGANKLGEFSLTDKRFSNIDRFMANTLFDENYGGKYGNCHVAVGASFSDTYAGDPKRLTKKRKEQLGFNDSALHWDLVNTEKKRVVAHLKTGGKTTIYENGRFKY